MLFSYVEVNCFSFQFASSAISSTVEEKSLRRRVDLVWIACVETPASWSATPKSASWVHFGSHFQDLRDFWNPTKPEMVGIRINPFVTSSIGYLIVLSELESWRSRTPTKLPRKTKQSAHRPEVHRCQNPLFYFILLMNQYLWQLGPGGDEDLVMADLGTITRFRGIFMILKENCRFPTWVFQAPFQMLPLFVVLCVFCCLVVDQGVDCLWCSCQGLGTWRSCRIVFHHAFVCVFTFFWPFAMLMSKRPGCRALGGERLHSNAWNRLIMDLSFSSCPQGHCWGDNNSLTGKIRCKRWKTLWSGSFKNSRPPPTQHLWQGFLF